MIDKLFNFGKKTPSTDFSKFFVETKAEEKKKVITKAIREANQDQKKFFSDDPV